MDEQKKQFKEALKSELTPLLIGLRNELKALGISLEAIRSKQPPEIQKTEITNYPEVPDVSKVELINPQKEVVVSNFPESVKSSFLSAFFDKATDIIGSGNKALYSAILSVKTAFDKGAEGLKAHIFNVRVENQKEIKFPEIQKVEVLNQVKQAESIKVANRTPEEAVPVVLTDRTLKHFYDVAISIFGGDINLGNIKAKLDEIKTVLENLDITINAGDIQIGAVEIKDGDSDIRLDVEADSGKNAAYVQSVSLLAKLEAIRVLLDTIDDSNEVHNNYKAFDVSITTTSQEIDFGGTFNLFAISIGSGGKVEVRLNLITNNPIVLGSQGNIAHDRFSISKVFIKTQTGTNDATIFASRKV